MLKRFFLSLVLLVASVTTALAAYPYDSICEVMAPSGNRHSAGSATLIAVSEDKALLLTCQHVVLRVGNPVYINWAATGEAGEGEVVAIGKNGLDVALVVCPRPKGLRPVPVSHAKDVKKIVNAGFPGVNGILEWQTGKVISLTSTDLRYTCRPIPGMSGGATFDEYGNLVGIIQYYNRSGGGSTSGVNMLQFLRGFIAKVNVSWGGAPVQHKEELVLLPDTLKTYAVENFDAFRAYVIEHYHGEAPESAKPTPAPKPAPKIEITISDNNIQRKRRPPQRRRLFRRRR